MITDGREQAVTGLELVWIEPLVTMYDESDVEYFRPPERIRLKTTRCQICWELKARPQPEAPKLIYYTIDKADYVSVVECTKPSMKHTGEESWPRLANKKITWGSFPIVPPTKISLTSRKPRLFFSTYYCYKREKLALFMFHVADCIKMTGPMWSDFRRAYLTTTSSHHHSFVSARKKIHVHRIFENQNQKTLVDYFGSFTSIRLAFDTSESSNSLPLLPCSFTSERLWYIRIEQFFSLLRSTWFLFLQVPSWLL